MSARRLALSGPQFAHIRDGRVRVSSVASTPGGGWNSQIPSPGGAVSRRGAVERDRRPKDVGG